MKYLILFIALAIAYVAFFNPFNTTTTQQELVGQSLQVQEKTESYIIDVAIDTTGFVKLDTEIALVNEINLLEFRSLASSSVAASSVAPYEYVAKSEKFSSSDNLGLDTLVVNKYEYTGGAHGNTEFETYTYGRDKGLRYDLENVLTVSPEFVTFLAGKTSKAIIEKDPQAELSELQTILEDSTNLQDFYISSDILVFLFEPYVVGPYALGDVKVEIPMEEVLPFARGSVKKAYQYQDQVLETGATTAQ